MPSSTASAPSGSSSRQWASRADLWSAGDPRSPCRRPYTSVEEADPAGYRETPPRAPISLASRFSCSDLRCLDFLLAPAKRPGSRAPARREGGRGCAPHPGLAWRTQDSQFLCGSRCHPAREVSAALLQCRRRKDREDGTGGPQHLSRVEPLRRDLPETGHRVHIVCGRRGRPFHQTKSHHPGAAPFTAGRAQVAGYNQGNAK